MCEFIATLGREQVKMSIPRSLMMASSFLHEILMDYVESPDATDNENNNGNEIPLASIDVATFKELVRYCDVKGVPEREDEFFIRIQGDREKMYDLLLASDFLLMDALVERLCVEAAEVIKSMDNEVEICSYLFLADDLSEDERVRIRTESEWCKYV